MHKGNGWDELVKAYNEGRLPQPVETTTKNDLLLSKLLEIESKVDKLISMVRYGI